MPLSALTTINIEDAFWQGWASYLTNIPTLSAQEGEVARLLNQQKPTSVVNTFVPQSFLPQNIAYESFIFEEHQIPTRDGLHDFFNGLCWFTFPRTKTAFNQLHQQQIAQLGTTHRGPIRDRLTILDENGLLIQCPNELWDALQQKNWLKAFLHLRPLWKQTKVIVFGHALLEKLVSPYKAITAHALRIPSYVTDSTSKDDNATSSYEKSSTIEEINNYRPKIFSSEEIMKVDQYLTHYLTEHTLKSKPYIPLQVFGIPGWSHEPQDAAFYADQTVFRPQKTKEA